MQFPSKAIWVTSLNSLSTYATCLLIELCQIVVTLWENHFIRPWSRSHTCPLTCYTSTLEDSKYIHPPTNKTSCCTMSISLQSYHHNVWAIQKEIKYAYPKKVCHMPTRHVKKKKRKDAYPKKVCHMPTRHDKKKREKENIAHTKKNITREREFI